ncbi:hypothetical protein VNI00_004715 [Paramarasmius palmivorus]|uniref:Uncharacterized protein n=1 Tax=Paramarasmius palmivorus TaxID=297713 RepID=A0AAW0DIJ9_9AGAR
MEVIFDNKSNVLNAKLHTTLDDAVIYTLETTYGFRGRRLTVLKDTNPLPGRRQSVAGPATGVNVGSINWREKIMEVNGVRKKIADLKKRKGGYFSNVRRWQWSSERKEYDVRFKNDEFGSGGGRSLATHVPRRSTSVNVAENNQDRHALNRLHAINIDPSNGDGSTTLDPAGSADDHGEDQEGVVGRFQVPFRPHLFTKSRAPKLRIKGAALVEDEVFLILVLIYSEAKRQDKTNSSITSEGT